AEPSRRSRRAERATPAPRRAKRRRGVLRRMFTTLLLLALLAGAGVAAYVATSSQGNSVQLRKVTYDQANRVVDELNQLIDDNTR
ncbi:MAG: serine/threonine protein kinase, partial [Conexibacter sp.]|nr:serine/threonine protein kinase [Conexibacter sp.]